MKTITLTKESLAGLLCANSANALGLNRAGSNVYLMDNYEAFKVSAQKLIDEHGDKEESKIILG